MLRLKLRMGLSDADCQPRMNGCHELNVMYELRRRCKMAGQKGRPRKQPQEPEEPRIENEEPVNEDDHEHNEQPESEDELL
ncbi:hypothetical protein E3N88_00052 [Mikania micrantha]|uniref:Uncharacterized protein n=1 Tax=Mikania micrantha TaxID=192012 RepID=A0A5N6PYT2_9ASTR|nr:hypothetical protein E3N88_00052 [Mikania micrantha]